MIPREILKKIRLIELRTNRLVSERMAGQYHSVFKGQGMNFDEVREYQPGDDVRSIDWNVTARMNHPFVKKFVEERELTVVLVVDLSNSMDCPSAGENAPELARLHGNHEDRRKKTKREQAAEIASVLAFSAIRNNDKVGLILFTDRVERYVPPRKGRRHVLRVIRDILAYEPEPRTEDGVADSSSMRQRSRPSLIGRILDGVGLGGEPRQVRHRTDLTTALDYMAHVIHQRAIVVVVSDFLGDTTPSRKQIDAHLRRKVVLSHTLRQSSLAALRQANRRHDVVAVQVLDSLEKNLPDLGHIVLKDAETGELVEIDTGDERRRASFAGRQERFQSDLRRLLESAKIDSIQLMADQEYATALARFFETREKRRRRG